MSKDKIETSWEPATLIADRLRLRRKSVQNVINLLDDGATIPFIARYRKEQTDDMGPEMLREVATGVEDLRSVETKIQSVYSSIQKMGKMTNVLETSLRFATSLLEVDTLYAPFKPGHKGTHAERARALGLGVAVENVLSGQRLDIQSFIDVSKKGLQTAGDIEKGIKHIIADIVSKDKDVISMARTICQECNVLIESTRVKAKTVAQDKKEIKGEKTKKTSAPTEAMCNKFEQYFNFKIPVKNARPHQILAVNRGEDLKILSVKIVIPDQAKARIINSAQSKYLRPITIPYVIAQVREAIQDAYDRLIEPSLCRQIRSDLMKDAEKASISVFNSNLKNLLLVSPVKGQTILGIDPGFRNGCKTAVISPTGQVLDTAVIYLHDFKANKFVEKNSITGLVLKYKCDIIAVGNGVACRETEAIISDMIRNGHFKPLEIVYSIVDECGASIYSVSPEAQKELPDFDPTLRGAVSIARRLQDPLAELVKIEPKHLGVGMYQHDMNKTKLETALSSVVEECVSFVGVDVNTCSECLLRRVAGLNATKAKNIIAWRVKNGCFVNRQQLLGIKGLGKKGFEQCAGFIRITNHGSHASENDVKEETIEEDEKPFAKGRKRKTDSQATVTSKKSKKEDSWNPLDATAVHPESYDIAHKLMNQFQADAANIGHEEFIRIFKKEATEERLKQFCEANDVGHATVKFIADVLKRPLAYDLREGTQKPLFKQDIVSMNDLSRGKELTGRVLNVTHFGAFVDIGVSENGMIHNSKMGRFGRLAVGDRVEVKVDNIDLDRKRIGLVLLSVNSS